MFSHFISLITSLNFKYVLTHSFIPHLLNALYMSGTGVKILIGHYHSPEAVQGGLVSAVHYILINTFGMLISFSFLCFHQEKISVLLIVSPWF